MALRIIVTGTAQDAGVPQIGCSCTHCRAAREIMAFARTGASLALLSPGSTDFYLVDAGPHLRVQVDRLLTEWDLSLDGLKGIFVTHAHWGHIGGLGMLSKVAADVRGVHLFSSPEALEFLAENFPSKAMVRRGNISLDTIEEGQRTELFPGVHIEAFEVPHRPDAVRTYGFSITDRERTILYIPDMDELTPGIMERIAHCDITLMDGTFFSDVELPQRDLTQIPHPLVSDSIRKLSGLTTRIVFTHINHSNPLNDPRSPEYAAVTEAGMEVASEFMTI